MKQMLIATRTHLASDLSRCSGKEFGWTSAILCDIFITRFSIRVLAALVTSGGARPPPGGTQLNAFSQGFDGHPDYSPGCPHRFKASATDTPGRLLNHSSSSTKSKSNRRPERRKGT